MTDSSALLHTLLSRSGCAYLLLDSQLVISEASQTIDQISSQDAGALAGKKLLESFPEFAEYENKLKLLFEDSSSQLRFRTRRGENIFLMVSAQTMPDDPSRVLVLFEDVTLLVLRTDILGRRVKELESRCQSLERTLVSSPELNKSEAVQVHFDPTTGLYDIDYMIKRLVEEETFSRHWKRPLSVVVFRLPEEAVTGNQLPREQQEQIIKTLSEIVRQHFRSMDMLGRLDDTSLIALLPQTPREGAVISSQRILNIVKQHNFGLDAKLELVIGISEMEIGKDDTALKMFERAKSEAVAA